MSPDDQFRRNATGYVVDAWERIFRICNTVISHSNLYGFEGIKLIENPNIQQILSSATIVSGMLENILKNMKELELTHDDVRMLLNSRQAVTLLEDVAAALLADNEDLYNESVQKLQQQASF